MLAIFIPNYDYRGGRFYTSGSDIVAANERWSGKVRAMEQLARAVARENSSGAYVVTLPSNYPGEVIDIEQYGAVA